VKRNLLLLLRIIDSDLAQDTWVLGGNATYLVWKVKDGLDGLLDLVLPHNYAARSGLVQPAVDKRVFSDDDNIVYDASFVNDLVPLLQTIASYDVYENEVDDYILDVMQYFEDNM
jgi:hypothetical protein